MSNVVSFPRPHAAGCICIACQKAQRDMPWHADVRSWTPPEFSTTKGLLSDRMLTDEQLGTIYAELYSDFHNQRLHKLYSHIRAQADLLRQFTN